MSDITKRTINSSKVIITPKKKKIKNTENTTPKLVSQGKTRGKGKSKSQNHKRKIK